MKTCFSLKNVPTIVKFITGPQETQGLCGLGSVMQFVSGWHLMSNRTGLQPKSVRHTPHQIVAVHPHVCVLKENFLSHEYGRLISAKTPRTLICIKLEDFQFCRKKKCSNSRRLINNSCYLTTEFTKEHTEPSDKFSK
jgi:hypothetical protein